MGMSALTIFPSRITDAASEMAMASLSLWVMMMTVLPSERIRSMTLKSSSTSCGVRTAVGSSRMRICAPR